MDIFGLIIGIVLIIALLIILWGFIKGAAKEEEVKPKAAASVPERAVEVEPLAPAKATVPEIPVKADDLTLIEGIGPKIASLLKANGIVNFAQLAAAEIPFLEKILRDAGLQFAKPASWPEQAALAAAGKMEELKALQEKLVGGR